MSPAPTEPELVPGDPVLADAWRQVTPRTIGLVRKRMTTSPALGPPGGTALARTTCGTAKRRVTAATLAHSFREIGPRIAVTRSTVTSFSASAAARAGSLPLSRTMSWMFVPDQAPTALAFVSQLAAWGVPLRRGPGAAGGRVQLLGMAGWASSLIIDRVTALTENAVFAEAFDAASWLAAAIDIGAGDTGLDQSLRVAVRQRLGAPSEQVGATGVVHVEDDHVRPRVHLLTVQGTTVRARLAEDEELVRRTPVTTGESP